MTSDEHRSTLIDVWGCIGLGRTKCLAAHAMFLLENFHSDILISDFNIERSSGLVQKLLCSGSAGRRILVCSSVSDLELLRHLISILDVAIFKDNLNQTSTVRLSQTMLPCAEREGWCA